MNNFKCPNCGESDYIVHYSTSTALYAPAHFVNGKQVSSDPNYHTSYCTCCKCSHDFTATEHEGNITYEDKGMTEQIPVIPTPITIDDTKKLTLNDLTVKSSTEKTSVTIPSINDLLEKIIDKLDQLNNRLMWYPYSVTLGDYNTTDQFNVKITGNSGEGKPCTILDNSSAPTNG